ncbi:fungal chitosanase [Xylaria curta]|nr:fungal chitosanase [Xylaria curta]
MFYGVWGDQNGNTSGGKASVGEASLSLATACSGQSMGANNGHDENDVLHIAFVGKDAVAGKKANWAAKNFDEFESSIKNLGIASLRESRLEKL